MVGPITLVISISFCYSSSETIKKDKTLQLCVCVCVEVLYFLQCFFFVRPPPVPRCAPTIVPKFFFPCRSPETSLTCWLPLLPSQFRFADRWDVVLLIFGTLMSMVNGTVMPLMCLVFGDMTDSFISAESSKYNLTGLSGFLLKHVLNRTPGWAVI